MMKTKIQIILLTICVIALLFSISAAVTPETDSVKSKDGVMIYYDIYNPGHQPLIFVHGWCSDASSWKNQADFFSKEFTVITVDLGGHGRSGQNRTTWSMSAYGGDVASVIENLDLKNVVLIGHSMGGAVCIEAARQAKGRIKAIIGVDTYQNLGKKATEEEITQFLIPFRQDFKNTASGFIRSIFPQKTDTALVNRIVARVSSSPVQIAIGSLYQLFQYDAAEALKDFNLPIRCINSDMYLTDISSARGLVQSFEVEFMKGYGHFVHLENPTMFNDILTRFMTEFRPMIKK
jgi:pimeloyl-ACP methyl ester carboxylesterase